MFVISELDLLKCLTNVIGKRYGYLETMNLQVEVKLRKAWGTVVFMESGTCHLKSCDSHHSYSNNIMLQTYKHQQQVSSNILTPVYAYTKKPTLHTFQWLRNMSIGQL